MTKEKVINEIVDEVMAKVIERKLPREYILSPNNIKQYNNREEITDTYSKKEEKSDLVKKFISKKERGSKVAINNDNIGLYLEQERDGKGGWNVYIRDLSVDNNPRMERKKFGNNYGMAEKYYGKLFFKYQFNEIKKEVKDVTKDDNSNLISLLMIKNRNDRIFGDHQFNGAIHGMLGGASISFFFGSLLGMWMPIQFFISYIVIIMMLGTAGGGILGYLTFDDLMKALC